MHEINKPLLFIGGDLNGIQNFIYNISSKKAAVSLKGRSAWLNMYLDKVCRGIIDIPEIAAGTTKEIIYCSGGKFYAICDDSATFRHLIDDYIIRTESELWTDQNGQIFISITYTPFVFKTESVVVIDGKEYPIGELWRRTNSEFNKKKKRKFCNTLLTDYDSLFQVRLTGGDVRVCAITGIESPGCVKLEEEDDGESIWVLPSVKKQVELGRELRKKEHFKTFQEYAEKSYLGVLRMDVDGLGTRFIAGFKTIDDYTSFSGKLQLFFDRNLIEIQKKIDYSDYLNIIYAGGDDIFVVGRWDKVLDFAEETRAEFIKYIGDEKLTISGGIAIVGQKFPISKAAELSGEAEDRAKKYKNGNKNAFSFLGDCVSWDYEFQMVKNLKNDFVLQISQNGLSAGILHKLMSYASIASEGKNMNYLWHSVYYLTRLMSSTSNYNAKCFVKNIRDNEVNKGVRQYQLIALAARWAELELRFSK